MEIDYLRCVDMQFCMDWKRVNFDWNRARAFLVTAEEGSLSAASRALGMTQPTLGRQVSALEQELGVVLFERVGRGLQLTESGLELVEHVRGMGEAATRMSLTASGQSQSIEGTVRITASEVGATFTLPPLAVKFRSIEPGIRLEIVSSNEVQDLRRREADIAIRSVAPKDPSLIARKLRDGRAELFAAKTYISRLGGFNDASALANADFIGFDDNGTYLHALQAAGVPITQANFPISSDTHIVQWECVKAGAGVGVMASEVGDSEPLVTRAAPWLEPFSYGVWLVSHRELRTNRRLRLVFDWLADEMTSAKV